MPSLKTETWVTRRTDLTHAFALLVVGIVAGILIAWSLLTGDLNEWSFWVNIGIRTLVAIFLMLTLALVIVVPLGLRAVNRFAENANGSLNKFVVEIIAATRAASERNSHDAAAHAERASLEAIAWYGPIVARRWLVQTALALLVAFGGMVGTALLFRQIVLLNEQNKKLEQQTILLKEQNEKIDLQTVTAEAQRRSVLTTELLSILKEVADASQERKQISATLKSRIIAFSRAATPYWTVEIPADRPSVKIPILARRARSPERGQLLVGLAAAGVDFRQLDEAVFEGADLRRAPLRRAKLIGVQLNGADLSYAELNDADLSKAQLVDADLSFSILLGASFNDETILDSAIIGQVGLLGAILPDKWPSNWSAPHKKYQMTSRDGVIRLVQRTPPHVLPYRVPE